MKQPIMADASEQEKYNNSDKEKEFEKYEIESAADCLVRAEEIKMNEKLYPLVQEELKKKETVLSKISSLKDLKKVANKKAMEELEEKE